MALEALEVLNGLLSLIVVCFALTIGSKISSVYFKTKKKEFLFVGIVAFLLTEPWWPSTVSFLIVITGVNENGLMDNPEIYFILVYVNINVEHFLNPRVGGSNPSESVCNNFI